MRSLLDHPTTQPSRAAIFAIGGVVLALVVVGIVIGSAEPALGVGRALPRIPAPPADPMALARRLGVGTVTWYACVLAILPLWWLAMRYPLTHQRPVRHLSIHLAVVVCLVALTSVAHYAYAYRGSPYAPSFLDFAPVALGSNVVPLLAVAAIIHVLEGRRRALRNALESQRLRAELAESRLAAVTMQLHPHFLFNTLQSISTLIHRDPVAADAMLVKLSDLLREVLRRSTKGMVSLGDELGMTETYLDLARMRFGERLHVTLDIDETARDVAVPVLLLQPLIENALKHGVGRRAAGGNVGVSARRRNGNLTVTVWDDGEGLARGAEREGTGLGNTRERLRHAFGDDYSMELTPRDEGGVKVTIRMPARDSAALG